jgi:hypothetical protein
MAVRLYVAEQTSLLVTRTMVRYFGRVFSGVIIAAEDPWTRSRPSEGTMQIRSFILIVILGAVGALAAFNWDTFNTPSQLWLGVTTVEAPLGMVMLGTVAVLVLFFLLSIGYIQSLALLESRRHAKELHANRELADQAEISRFTELKHYIATQLESIAQQDRASRLALQERLDRLDSSVSASIEQTGNGLAACIAEMDDRLEHNRIAALRE